MSNQMMEVTIEGGKVIRIRSIDFRVKSGSFVRWADESSLYQIILHPHTALSAVVTLADKTVSAEVDIPASGNIFDFILPEGL